MVSLLGMFLIFAGTGLAQEGYIHIDAHSFSTWDGASDYACYGGGTGITCYVQRNNSTGYLSARLEFPPEADGLLVRQITISYNDNDASNNIEFYLRKVDLYDQGITTVASIDSSGSSSSWRRMYINRWDMSARRINNERYAWYVIVHFENYGSSLKLGNIKIKYATD